MEVKKKKKIFPHLRKNVHINSPVVTKQMWRTDGNSLAKDIIAAHSKDYTLKDVKPRISPSEVFL